MAVLAGVLSEVMASYFGHIGPFQLAIALTGLALLLILTWRENFGNPDATAQVGLLTLLTFLTLLTLLTLRSLKTLLLLSPTLTMAQDNVREGLKCILGEKSVIALGLMSSLFEGNRLTLVALKRPSLPPTPRCTRCWLLRRHVHLRVHVGPHAARPGGRQQLHPHR